MRVIEQRERSLSSLPPGESCQPIAERDLAAQQFVDGHIQPRGELQEGVQRQTAASALCL